MSREDFYTRTAYGQITSATALKRHLDRYIIGQEEAKMTLCTAVSMHLQRYQMRKRDPDMAGIAPNVIVYGPSGGGKTAIIRRLAEHTGLPMTIESAPGLIPSGARNGKSLDEVLYDLYVKAERDLNRAEAGIIVLDEFDKLSARGDQSTNNAQYMYHLQNDLLTFVEGGKFRCWGNDANGKEESVMIDTSNILFIGLGAFEGLGSAQHDIGFLCDPGGDGGGSRNEDEDVRPQLQDFINYGLRRELMGRMPLRCRVNALTEDDYRRILLDSEGSPLLDMEQFFRFSRNSFLLSNTVVDVVILAASLSGIGARSFRSLLQDVLDLPLFLLGDKRNTTFVVDEEFLRSKKTEDLKMFDDAALPRLLEQKDFSYCSIVLKKVLKSEARREAAVVDGPF